MGDIGTETEKERIGVLTKNARSFFGFLGRIG